MSAFEDKTTNFYANTKFKLPHSHSRRSRSLSSTSGSGMTTSEKLETMKIKVKDLIEFLKIKDPEAFFYIPDEPLQEIYSPSVVRKIKQRQKARKTKF
jgi:hypothetical protein